MKGHGALTNVCGRPSISATNCFFLGNVSSVAGSTKPICVKLIYRDQDFERAASLIKTRGFDLESPLPGFNRSEAPHGGSEKYGARAVAQDLVAVVPLGMDMPVPDDGFLAMPWQSTISLQYQVLLVCENLETFLQLREYLWLADLIKGRPTLGLFRGMVHTFGTDGAARLIEHDSCNAA